MKICEDVPSVRAVAQGGGAVSGKRGKKKPMGHINIGELGRGQASKLLKQVADEDEVAYVLRYGKPLVVVMSHDRYERLVDDGVDPNDR